MKKFFLFFFLLGLILTPFVFADVQVINLQYCDDGFEKEMRGDARTLVIEPGSEREICLSFTSRSEEKMNLSYGFAKGVLSDNGQLCDANLGSSDSIAKFITSVSGSRNFEISSLNPVILREKIRIPLGMSGMLYGCIAFNPDTPEAEKVGGMFNLVVRRAMSLNIFVGGESVIKNSLSLKEQKSDFFSTNKKVKILDDGDDGLKLSFLVKNDGNITQNVVLSGKLYNMLGFEKDFVTEEKKLGPGESYDFVAPIGIIPFYKGLFDLKFTMRNTPVFDFDAAALGIKAEGGSITETGKFFVFSRIIVIVLAFIVLIILWSLLKKKRNIITQTMPPSPISPTAV